MRGLIIGCMLVMLALVAMSCAKQHPRPDLLGGVVAPAAPAQEVASPAPAPESVIPYHPLHTIQPGDCLWNLSDGYYGDPFLWPLIWKENRDFIKDPDFIEIGDNLEIPRDVSTDEQEYSLGIAYRYRGARVRSFSNKAK